MMTTLSDDELILELKKRFDHTKQALYDVKMMTKTLEEVNKKLKASEKVKSNFVSHMKNEINNPLSSILGLSAQIISGIDNPELVQSVAGMIHSEAFSLDFQLRNIFAAAEFESGDTDLHVAMVELPPLFKDSLDSFGHLIQDKNIHLNITSSSEDPLIFKTDAEKLELIFDNLLSNAIEFNQTGGTIDIHYEIVENQLNLQVKDSGIGLEMSNVHKIFDRFQQVETGITKSHKGHGLGLSIVKAIVDMLEGSISVDCNNGQGCTFSVTIPPIEMDIEADAFSVDGNEFFFDDDQVEAF
ncbi:MAG: HAMP domain-containing histidine kinase [Magnetococcus sp. DMHC-6]